MQNSVEIRPVNPWLQAARPRTLPAAVAPVLIGGALAGREGSFELFTFLWILLTALVIQILANYVNDLSDFEQGVDSGDRLGPLRVTQAGLISPGTMRAACYALAIIALLLGLHLVKEGGLLILIIGLLSIVSACAYSVGKFSFSRQGLGEIFVLLFFGFIPVAGTCYIFTHSLSWSMLLYGACPGLLSCGILAINNLRDLESDRSGGRKTLAVRFGERFARREYAVFVHLALLIALIVSTASELSVIPWLIVAGIVSGEYLCAAVFRGAKGIELNVILARTGLLLLWTAGVVSVAICTAPMA